MGKILLNPYRNAMSIDGLVLTHDTYLNQSVKTDSNVTFQSITCGNLTASGTIYLSGVITEVETQNFIVKDSFVTLNDNSTDNVAPLNSGGIKILRGPSLPYYEIIYSESDQTARFGIAGNLQPIAAREESPNDGYLAIWNAASKSFITVNTFAGPLIFDGILNFNNDTYFGNTVVSGDLFDNFTIANSNSIILNTNLVKINDATLSFSNTVSLSLNGNFLQVTGDMGFLENKSLLWGTATISGSSNSLNLSGTNISLNGNINFTGIVNHGIAQFQVAAGNMYQLSSSGNISLTAGTNCKVYIQNLSLGAPSSGQIDFVNSISGDLSIDTAGNITLSPDSYVLINANKNLCFGNVNNSIGNTTFGDVKISSTAGIILQAATQVYLSSPLNFGSYSSLFESTGNGNLNITSISRDILITPGSARNVILPANNSLIFGITEKIHSDGANFIIESQGKINFATPVSVNVPILTFGDNLHYIYQDNSGTLNVSSSNNVNISGTAVQLSSLVKIGSTKIYQDTDNALTLSSEITYVKSIQDFFVTSTTAATEAGAGSIKTLGGLFVGSNLYVTSQIESTTISVGNGVVTMSDSASPLKITNSSNTNGTSLALIAQWDTNESFTIGRGTNSTVGGRAMVFTVPSYQIYGVGSRPSFVFSTNTGIPFMTVSDTLTSIVGDVSGQGDAVFGGSVEGLTFTNSSGSFSVTDSLVSITNSGLSVGTQFTVLNSSQNPIFTVDSTGGFTTVLPSTLDSVSMTNATISGTLNGETANFAGNVNFSADVNLSGNRCYNVATPQYDSDVTTKLYVDSVAIGRTDKQAVKVASTSPISDLSNPIYNIDGASVTLSDRVLLKDQANPVDNGIYTLDVNNVPQRSADFAIGMDVSGASVFVITGIENGSVGFVVINTNNIVGTDSIQWTPFSGPSTINVTVPITKTGITLGLDLDNFSITTNPMGKLSVKNSFFGSGLSIDTNGFVVTDSNQSNITQLGTITSGNWEGTIISTPYGGTGLSSIPTGNILYGNGVNQLGNSNNLVYSAGNLGVGTASPGSNITVVNASGTYQGTRISIIDTDTIMSQSSGVTISNIENSASISVSNTGTLVLSQDTASVNSKVAISTQGNQRLTIDSDGNVMINTAVPNSTSIFTVSGEIYTTGQFVSQYLNLFSLANFTVDNLSNIGGILLTASALRITSDVIVNGDLTTGNLTLKSTTSDSTISISDPTKNVKFRVSANPSGLYAIGKVGALVIPNSLQIGGDETDVTTGFTLENVNGNLTVNPGITGQSLTIMSNSVFSAPVSFTTNNDTFTFSVDSGVLQLVADSSSSTYSIGNMIANFGVALGGFSYDPTNTTEFSGGLFSTKEMTGVSFGNQVSLEKELRFSQINSLEGSFGFNGNGFYYLGELLGRIIVSVTGHWDITIDYDGNNYSVTRLSIYDRSKINLRIYDNGLGSYFVFLIVIAGPISVKVIQSPTKLFYNKFEGSSSAPSGTYSGFTGSWVLDFDLISNVSIGSIDLGQLTVSNSATVNNLSMTGNTNVTGPITVDGESYFSGNHFTWFGTLTNSFLSALNSSELENSLTVYGKDAAAATIYLEKASAAGYVSVLSSGDPVYPNALIISQSTQDPTSQIVFKTRDAAQMTINSLGNVNILTTLNVAGLVSFEHDLQVSGNLQTSGLQINSSPIFTYSGNQLSLGNSVISNVADPVNNTDVVNLQTLYSFVQGLKTKESVVAASTTSIDLSNPVTILDGVLLSVDDRILVKDQSDKTENGIYVIQVLAPVRSSDFFVGEEVTGTYVFVSSGVINEASGWVVSNSSGSGELQVGVNDITFTQFSGAGEISAGNGIVKTGNSLSVKLDTGSLEFSGNGSIRISNTIAGDGLSGGSGNPLSVTDISHLSVLGTISQGTWQGNPIAIEYGGTGLTSITAGSVPFSNGSSLAEGLLYFDQFNVRLGINTLFPISGLTVNDRDMNIVQSLSPVTNLLFTDTVNNYMYSVRNDTTSLVFSGGTGNNKTALTDLAQFDSTGTFTCNFGLNSSFVKLQDALFFTEDSVVKTVNGPLTIDYFSNDNSGTYLRFFGGMGNYNSSVDSELMTIGYFAGDYVIDVSKSGNGNFNPLILQTGSTSLSLNLDTVILSKDTVILGTTDSSSQSTGALTVLGGIGVLGSIFGSNANLTGTLDCNTFNANTFTLGSIYSLGNDNGILEVTGMITGNPALVHFYNFNAANTLDTLYRIFGFGKDVTSNSEWLQMGFESSNINYAIRVSSIGAGTLRPLILGFSNGNDQLILSPDGSTSVSGSLNTNSLSVFSTSDATSSHNSGAASIQGGLSVGKSLYVGTLINSNLIQSTGVLQYSNGSSIDKVYVSYSNSGNLNFYNNFNLNHNIHVANSQGPNSVNQERLTLGYRDLNTISINSTASGSGLTRDLAIETRFFPNQILLSATTGVTTFNYPVKINDTTENSFVTLGSASVSGNLIINGSGSFGSTTFNGNILTMYGYDNTWQFSTINSISNTTFLSPVTTDAILQITTADNLTNLLTIDTVNNVVSSSSSLIVSNTGKAFNIQNSSKIDSFVFDTQNHLLDVLGGRIVNLALPQSPSDAVNKVYVDNLLSGLNTKQSVNLATTSNLNVLNSIDGTNVDSITVTIGMRLLLKNQINAVENGIYNVSTSGFLTRASDMANGTHAAAAYTFVQQGTINADTGYVCITVSPGDVVGTNSITFTQFNGGGGSINFGDGIIYDNGTYSVALDSNSGLSFNGGKLTIDASLAGTGLSYNLGVLSLTGSSSGTITSGTWNADTITVPYGGTGNTAFSEGSIVYSDGTILQGTSGINWNATSSVLGINFSNTDASNGLSIQDKDINLITNLENSSSVLFSRNSNYLWRIRNDSGQSTKSTLPVSTSIQVKMSNDGTLGIILTDAGTPDYMTVNSGKTWVPTTLDGTLHAFTQIAMSHDGQYILMSARQDYLYLSQNYGSTWQQKVTDFTRLWEWVSVSNSGQFQIASSLDDGLFTSQDSGSTWNLIENLPTEVTDIGFVFCTGGAAMIFAGYTPGDLYYSTDNGVTFAQHTIRSGNWYDMVQSSGSNYLALYEYPGSLWVSNDLGNTFTETAVVNKYWVSVSISGDGSVFIAAARNDLIYLSTDFGQNFTATLDTNPRIWTFVRVSSDSTTLFAGGDNIPVYMSSDGGVIWTTISGNIVVNSADLGADVLFYPEYQGLVHSYSSKINTNLVISTGNSPNKVSLQDTIVLTDAGFTGFGFTNTESGLISATVDIKGSFHVVEDVEFDIALDVVSGGTGCKTLTGLVIGNGISSLTGSGKVLSGCVPVGSTDNSGEILLQSGNELRSTLGLGIGIDVQGYSETLTNFSNLIPTNGYFVVSNGSNFVTASPGTVESTLGLGNLAFSDTIDNGNFSGTSLSVSNGGTGNNTFTSNVFPFFDGTKLTNSIIYNDSINACVAIGTTSGMSNVKLLVQGDDICLKGNGSTPVSFLFANNDGNIAWRIRKEEDGIVTGNTNFVISGGVPNANSDNLIDQLSISSSGIVSISNTTETISPSSGSLVISGGLGVLRGISSAGLINFTNTSDTSVNLAGGIRILGPLNLLNTTDATSVSNGAVSIAGGLSLVKNFFTAGSIILSKSTINTSKASGITVASDVNPYTPGLPIDDSDRHMTLVNGSANGSVVFTMKNTTAAYGFDLIVDNDKFIYQTNQGSVNQIMSLNAADSVVTVLGTGDSSLVVSGGISVLKSITTVGNVNSGPIVSVTNEIGPSKYILNNDLGSASLILNNSTDNTDGDFNELTLRNGVGDLRVQNSANLGITISGINGVVTVDSTVDSTETNNGCLIVNGGLAVKKSVNIGADFTVEGTFTANDLTSSPMISTPAGDTSNVTSLSVFSTNLITINTTNTLSANFQVTPTSNATATFFTFSLPNKISNLSSRLDVSAFVSAYYDTVNLLPVSAIATGVNGSLKVIVKFTSGSTTAHFLQVQVNYSSQ